MKTLKNLLIIKRTALSLIIYGYIEELNEPVDNIISDSTRQISKQVPFSYCCLVVKSDEIIGKPVLYCGENAVKIYFDDMQLEISIGKMF